MIPENFVYWLNGFVELRLTQEPPTQEQWNLIKEHLALVFQKVTNPLMIINPTVPAPNKCEPTYCTPPNSTTPLSRGNWSECVGGQNQIAYKAKEMSPSLNLSICGNSPQSIEYGGRKC